MYTYHNDIFAFIMFNSQHIDVIAEYKKKLENDRPVLNLVVIGEFVIFD